MGYDAHTCWKRNGRLRIRAASPADPRPPTSIFAWHETPGLTGVGLVAEIDHLLVAYAEFARVLMPALADPLAPPSEGDWPTVVASPSGDTLLVTRLAFWSDVIDRQTKHDLTRRLLHRQAVDLGVDRMCVAALTQKPERERISWPYWIQQAEYGYLDADGLSLAAWTGCRSRLWIDESSVVLAEWENPVRAG